MFLPFCSNAVSWLFQNYISIHFLSQALEGPAGVWQTLGRIRPSRLEASSRSKELQVSRFTAER